MSSRIGSEYECQEWQQAMWCVPPPLPPPQILHEFLTTRLALQIFSYTCYNKFLFSTLLPRNLARDCSGSSMQNYQSHVQDRARIYGTMIVLSDMVAILKDVVWSQHKGCFILVINPVPGALPPDDCICNCTHLTILSLPWDVLGRRKRWVRFWMEMKPAGKYLQDQGWWPQQYFVDSVNGSRKG